MLNKKPVRHCAQREHALENLEATFDSDFASENLFETQDEISFDEGMRSPANKQMWTSMVKSPSRALPFISTPKTETRIHAVHQQLEAIPNSAEIASKKRFSVGVKLQE